RRSLLATRCTMTTRVSAGCTFTGPLRSSTLLRWLEIDARAPRLRQTDGNRLLRGTRAVLALADVLHFLAYELARLRAGRLSLTFILASPLDRSLLWHSNLR